MAFHGPSREAYEALTGFEPPLSRRVEFRANVRRREGSKRPVEGSIRPIELRKEPAPMAARNSRGVCAVHRRNACRKLAASLNPRAKAISSLVIVVSRRYFSAR